MSNIICFILGSWFGLFITALLFSAKRGEDDDGTKV